MTAVGGAGGSLRARIGKLLVHWFLFNLKSKYFHVTGDTFNIIMTIPEDGDYGAADCNQLHGEHCQADSSGYYGNGWCYG